MLYTGMGDDGKTKLFGCDQQRISKSSEIPEALGALDELNALLGVAKMRASDERIAGALREAQEALFIIQAQTAGADKRLATDARALLETEIARIEAEIPPVSGFSIAGGTELSALLDYARAVARRAERRVVAARDILDKSDLSKVSDETLAYLNRLSSLLFALARLANHHAGVAEESPRY